MAVLFAKQGIDYFLKLYSEIIKEEGRVPDLNELKILMYNKVDPLKPIIKTPIEKPITNTPIEKKECLLSRDTRIKQSRLIELNIIVPFLPDEILYTGCKALKLYAPAQGKREGLFLPCCSPADRNGICTFCLKAGFVEKYGDLSDRLQQRGKIFIAKNNKQEIPYDKWIDESKKYNLETMKQQMKKFGIKLSIFQEKRRERTPSTSSDEEDKYTAVRTITYKGCEYQVTGANTIYNEDGDVVGRYDDDGEAIWNF